MPNSSFSAITPNLQLAIDSTSLGAYKTCPRYYQYSILLGWEPKGKSVHLLFGLWMHEGRERYYRDRWNKISHEDALVRTIHWALQETWNPKLGRPWISNHSAKNRLTLIRTLVWYLDKYGEDDPLQTVELPSGPAVEASFSFGTGKLSQDGEEFLLCGHLDRIVVLNRVHYISDLKTTGSILHQEWFDQFTPDNQFSLYVTAAQVVYHEPISDLIVDGCQILANGSRFQRGVAHRSESQLEEWWRETLDWWIPLMESSARSGVYPMNDKACLSADTIVTVTRGTRKSWKMSISKLYDIFHGISSGNRLDENLETYLLSDADGLVANNKVLDVLFKGTKPVFELQTMNGMKIKATADHEFKTPDGWVRLDQLEIDDVLLCWRSRGKLEEHDKAQDPMRGQIGKLYYYPYGYLRESKSQGIRNRRLGKVQRVSRLQIEAAMNGLILEEFVRILRTDEAKAKSLQYLDPGLEVHHKNHNARDDSLSNLEAINVLDHKEKHIMKYNTNRIGTTLVTSIREIGIERVFDTVMLYPHNNFIANGLVAHNCGNYGGCPYRKVCSKPPSLRDETLQREYTRRVWDPLKIRGDI